MINCSKQKFCFCGMSAIIVVNNQGYCNDHAWIVDDHAKPKAETKPAIRAALEGK